jgi:hypothetical protein
VLQREYDYIEKWRERTGRTGKANLTGLALSGGGIRSAVFCLGVIQALAKNGVLKNLDYLSTVSGGGYIGCSLTWLTRQVLLFGTDAHNLPFGIDNPLQPPPKSPSGTRLLAYMRRHGSYLDPGGYLSLLSGVAVVLRGLILNLLVVWLPILAAIMVVLRVINRNAGIPLRAWMAPAVLAAILVLMAVGYSLYSGYKAARHEDMPYAARRLFESATPWVLIPFMVLLILGSIPLVSLFVDGNGWTIGSVMTAAGSALGLWSRLVPKESGSGIPAWVGPIAAPLVIYGLVLIGYVLSGQCFAPGDTFPMTGPAILLAVAVLIALAVGFVVDLNETTLHRFYRDRLMEAFMPDVDEAGVPKGSRAKSADGGLLSRMADSARSPYHLINAHLVLTRIDRRDPTVSEGMANRWRIRGGDSFVFAPLFSGGPAAHWHSTGANKALCKLTLATAMAVSGAAVNPDAASSGVGPQRNRSFAALMALLNIRLGYWLPNPRTFNNRVHARAPNHFNAGLRGVIDRLSQRMSYLELADGGNFENLGVYELLRRGVHTIVVCDATADPRSMFQDLQNLLSRAEADFGVTITFKPPPLGPLMPVRASPRQSPILLSVKSTPEARAFPLGSAFVSEPFVVGEIRYADGRAGKLYYIKPAIFEGLRLTILGFKGAFPAFPDDTTVNQFFDEARFEAYRELGFASTERMLAVDDVKRHLLEM